VPALKIYLLGQLDAVAGGSTPLHFPTRKSKSLLAYLVLYKERAFARPAIAGIFWPELVEERALRTLNTEVWRLRTLLRNAGLEPTAFLRSDHDSVGFRKDSDHWVDAAEFDAATRALSVRNTLAVHQDFPSTLARAVSLYRGDLVEGLFDEWCLVEREAYRARYMAALDFLLTMAMDLQRWQDAISHGRQLLELDPLQEHVHRALMRCHFRLGNRAAALKQYQACAAILSEELQIEPMDETLEVYRMVSARPRSGGPVKEGGRGRRPRVAQTSPVERIDAALASLAAAQISLEDARRQLDGAGGEDADGGGG
jgi:DNA-binding SARP family transcriptional activator